MGTTARPGRAHPHDHPRKEVTNVSDENDGQEPEQPQEDHPGDGCAPCGTTTGRCRSRDHHGLM
ncbi:hypothetical protein DTL70_24145 [Streptomyces diacarni]|uniref:Uncharacterized protein n=1 Tax=Streptomyces diacarni TaxID=2800381 RepID=A0A367EQ15_9ACTN|nr:hypothetical protein DTL70_24145 [Streptomyces diacarni]